MHCRGKVLFLPFLAKSGVFSVLVRYSVCFSFRETIERTEKVRIVTTSTVRKCVTVRYYYYSAHTRALLRR
jgi:hypothetical protein